jgi:hypothetical protein
MGHRAVCHKASLDFFVGQLCHCAMMSERSKRRGGRVLVGYARTSTVDQNAGFEAQRRDLKAAGCTKIFQEQVSSVAERAQLDAAIDYLLVPHRPCRPAAG